MNKTFITGSIQVAGNPVPLVTEKLGIRGILGAVMVRWGVNRNKFKVNPGLYAIGSPDEDSDVFVSANYKLSFDTLRKNLKGINGWILVLDTRGVNVWCAAGKGTFSTNELIFKLQDYSVDKIVRHKRLILPQLGATGVAAHEVKKATGFNVNYGPVRAKDISKYISQGYKADRNMRTIFFGFVERLKLIPNDLIYGRYYLLGILLIVFIISAFSKEGFRIINVKETGLITSINISSAYISGLVLTPLILPYLPGRYFSLKGFSSGTVVFSVLYILNLTGSNIIEQISWFLIITSVSSFLAMNFTGSSTYTSLSGVKKEMKRSVPVQIIAILTGLLLLIMAKFI